MDNRGVILLAVAMTAVLGFVAACSSSNDNKDNNTPTPVATTPMASETGTPMAGETPQASTVNVNLTEWIVSAEPASLPAGSLTFDAKNISGATEHELLIIKTDLPEDGLPVKADGSYDSAAAGAEQIDEIESFPAGTEQSKTLDLAAGNYVLICNLLTEGATGATASHYANGMHAAFTVQ